MPMPMPMALRNGDGNGEDSDDDDDKLDPGTRLKTTFGSEYAVFDIDSGGYEFFSVSRATCFSLSHTTLISFLEWSATDRSWLLNLVLVPRSESP